MNHADDILKSWEVNAASWIRTIDDGELESRTLVTNAAIVATILKYKPGKVLDIGCGEGWLTRALQAKSIAAHGIDAVAPLIQNAVEKGGEHYSVCSYEDLIGGKGDFLIDMEAVVINFALLDQATTERLLLYLGKNLRKGALLFIQTLHPFTLAGEGAYQSGWREGSWKGLNQSYTQPYQWYFRTLEDWVHLFSDAGLALREMKEPIHPHTGRPASVIFVLNVSREKT